MSILDPETIIQSGGLLLIGLIVFAESGLLVGFFLPGDTLLFAAGFFASQDHLPLLLLLAIVVFSAVAGDNVGYSIGRRTGHRIFRKKDGIIFRQEYLARAEKFYEAHGGKTVSLARFIPIVRTFAPIVAGAAKMNRRRFMLFNIAGAFVWGVGIVLVGYFLGGVIPNIDTYILPAMAITTPLVFAPPLIHVFKDPVSRKRINAAVSRQWHRFLRLIGLNKEL